MRLLPLLLFALLTLTGPAMAAEERSYFGGWLAACRDDGYCSAVGYQNPNPGGGRVADNWFRIGRHAESTYWELSFTPVLAMADPAAGFTLVVDDKPETFADPAEVAAFGAVNDFYFMGPGAQAVMDRLMPGRRLDIRFTTDTGKPALARFSLDGLTAALIWIDEMQGRLGSERVAEAPPVGLDPVGMATPMADVVVPAIDPATVALMQLHNSESGCSVTIEPATVERVAAWPLDDAHTAYSVPCEDFAYNFIRVLYVWADGTMTPAVLPGTDASETDTSAIYTPTWDPGSATLTSFYKGGNGNCGSSGRWRWSEGGFVFEGMRAREACDQTDEPWPLTSTAP